MLTSAKIAKVIIFFLDFLKLRKVLSICAKFLVFRILPSEIKLVNFTPLPRANTRSKYSGGNRVKSCDFWTSKGCLVKKVFLKLFYSNSLKYS